MNASRVRATRPARVVVNGMIRPTTTLALLAFVALVFGGCADSDGSANDEQREAAADEATPEARVLFLDFAGDAAVPEFDTSRFAPASRDEVISAITEKIREALAPYDVDVVTTRADAHEPHATVVFANGDVTRLPTEDADGANESNVTFVFPDAIASDDDVTTAARQISVIAAHRVGHLLGFGDTTNDDDVMGPGSHATMLGAVAAGALKPLAATASALTGVPTYHSIGLYLPSPTKPTDPDLEKDATVKFRPRGTSTWKAGLSLWYDARNSEYRGSLVHLSQGTTYEIVVTLNDGKTHSVTTKTWNDVRPIAKTVTLPATSSSTLTITESGTPNGWIVYQPAPGKSAVIDVDKQANHDVVINAKYVIVRGLTLEGAKSSAILIGPSTATNSADVSDIVIEKNDISGWGTNATNDPACVASTGNTKSYGVNMQAGVFSRSTKLTRLTVQRNKIHHPSTNANSWKERNCAPGGSYHPWGPQALSIFGSQGNLVIRRNEIYSDDDHYFNDSMGEYANFSDGGFPNRDSDIYGNLIRNCWDDGIESEGANQNVRIWGNYIDQTYIKIGIAPVYRGPLYVFRNIGNVSRTAPTASYGQGFLKLRDRASSTSTYFGGGRIYVFNNTSMNPASGSGVQNWISEADKANKIDNLRSYNNVLWVESPAKNFSINEVYGTTNKYDYDLFNGKTRFNAVRAQEVHGRSGAPLFVSGAGFDDATYTGVFQLAAGSPGRDAGKVLPNFTDGFKGTAPDIGAHEAGATPMEFGVHAYE